MFILLIFYIVISLIVITIIVFDEIKNSRKTKEKISTLKHEAHKKQKRKENIKFIENSCSPGDIINLKYKKKNIIYLSHDKHNVTFLQDGKKYKTSINRFAEFLKWELFYKKIKIS